MKAHAVAIVRLAYILGYLKCHTSAESRGESATQK
jgi:hypothetical protein